MENNNNIDTTSLLLARGFGGSYGYGGFGGSGGGSLYTGNNVLAAEAHANGTAINARVEGNNGAIRDLGMNFENATRDRQVEGINKSIADAEFRSLDRQRDIERIINQNAKDAAQCCCDAKLDNCKQHAELLAEIKAVESRTIARELDTANARITQLETINALSNNNHGRG